MSFVYTMQAIAPRNRNLLRIALITALLVFAIWFIWFVFVPVNFYEYSTTAYIDDRGSVLATFDDDVASSFRTGQTANFQTLIAGQSRSYSARVMMPNNEGVQVSLRDVPVADRSYLMAGTQGEVSIVVAQLTPLQIVLRAIGNFT